MITKPFVPLSHSSFRSLWSFTSFPVQFDPLPPIEPSELENLWHKEAKNGHQNVKNGHQNVNNSPKKVRNPPKKVSKCARFTTIPLNRSQYVACVRAMHDHPLYFTYFIPAVFPVAAPQGRPPRSSSGCKPLVTAAGYWRCGTRGRGGGSHRVPEVSAAEQSRG